MFEKKQFFLFFAAYFLIRIFSFFFNPPTPLLAGSIVNTATALLILFLSVYWIAKKDVRGWLIIAGEILLCGSGNIFSVLGVSLRTLLLGASIFIFLYQTIKENDLKNIFVFKLPNIAIFFLLDWAIISAVLGAYHGHALSLVISDFIPYLFLLYYFPLAKLLKNDLFNKTAFNLLTAAFLANAVFIFFTYLFFTFGWAQMQDGYYHWFRDVAQGKITPLGFNFYRLVLNEHLLLIPLILFFIYQNMRRPNRLYDICIIAGALLVSLNLTRIYFLALIAGFIVLFSRKEFKQWFLNTAILLSCVFIFFTGFYLIASRGVDPGWSLFGFRVSSIALPEIEYSSFSRMLLLPQILYKIQLAPVLGHGLGDTVTIRSGHILGSGITTSHFDWGYLEILSESGAVGLILWLIIIVYAWRSAKKNTGDYRPLFKAILAALLVTNITSPALFHVFGILTIVLLMAQDRVFYEQYHAPLQNGEPPSPSRAIDKQSPATTG
jgi:O-antigen ligase